MDREIYKVTEHLAVVASVELNTFAHFPLTLAMQFKRNVFCVVFLAVALLASPVFGAPRHGDGNGNGNDNDGNDDQNRGGDDGHDSDRPFCAFDACLCDACTNTSPKQRQALYRQSRQAGLSYPARP